MPGEFEKVEGDTFNGAVTLHIRLAYSNLAASTSGGYIWAPIELGTEDERWFLCSTGRRAANGGAEVAALAASRMSAWFTFTTEIEVEVRVGIWHHGFEIHVFVICGEFGVDDWRA